MDSRNLLETNTHKKTKTVAIDYRNLLTWNSLNEHNHEVRDKQNTC